MRHILLIFTFVSSLLDCGQSASVKFNWFIELFHILAVGNNIWSDYKLLKEMKHTQKEYESKVKFLASEPNHYEYSFCYPQHYKPEWYDNIQNKTYLSCDCFQSIYDCLNIDNTSNISTINSNDIVCTAGLFGENKPYQQSLSIDIWECEECECNATDNLISYHSSSSLAVQRLYFEYDLMNDLNEALRYCNPYSIVNGKLNEENNINSLIYWSKVFLFIGTIIFAITICVRCCVLREESDKMEHESIEQMANINKKKYEHTYLYELTSRSVEDSDHDGDDNKVNERDAKNEVVNNIKDAVNAEHWAILTLFGTRIGAGFVANIFHDIPHQCILVFFMKFLYSDYGYRCFSDFVNSPTLHSCTFDSNEDIFVIFAKNWIILYSVGSSVFLVLFNSGYTIYAYLQEVDHANRAGAQSIEMTCIEDFNYSCSCCCSWFAQMMYYIVVFIIFFCLLFSHWSVTAYISYNYIAPALHRDWTILRIVFWCGIPVWCVIGLILLYFMLALLWWCCNKCTH